MRFKMRLQNANAKMRLPKCDCQNATAKRTAKRCKCHCKTRVQNANAKMRLPKCDCKTHCKTLQMPLQNATAKCDYKTQVQNASPKRNYKCECKTRLRAATVRERRKITCGRFVGRTKTRRDESRRGKQECLRHESTKALLGAAVQEAAAAEPVGEAGGP